MHGVYAQELTPQLVRSYEYFIVELNWFTQLREFLLIIKYIRLHSRWSKILFGGLYANLMFDEIFKRADVDYFIQGDNELPIKQFLDGESPHRIPNLVGREFRNDQTYHFREEELAELEFNLDWFPSFLDFTRENLSTPAEEYYKKHFPVYSIPMVFSTKGGCLSRHSGCGYCLGSKHARMRELYGRGIIEYDNGTVISLLKKVERKFDAVTFFIMSKPDFDFRGECFDLQGTIEFDCNASVDDVARVMGAFKKSNVHIALYEEGLTGESRRQDIDQYLELEDENHRVYFFSFRADADASRIPADKRLYSESVLPLHTSYKYYTNFDAALAVSDFFFMQLMWKSFFLVHPLRERMRTIVNCCLGNLPRVVGLVKYRGDLASFYVDQMIPEADRICQEVYRSSDSARASRT